MKHKGGGKKIMHGKKELEKEIGNLISDLDNYDPSTDEYKVRLVTIGKEMQVLESIKKLELDETRLKSDKARSEADVMLRARQADFEESKLRKQYDLETAKLNFDNSKLAQDKKFNEESLALKRKELELKEKSDKTTLIVSIAACTIPAVLGIVSNVIAMNKYNRLAVRALNMEYIDNSITPRSYNECMSNINKFIAKK